MSKAPSILPLKIFVISFGLLLIGGTVFVVAALVDKANKMQAASNCPPAVVSLRELKVDANISAITPAEKTITVTASNGAATNVLTLDRCTGKLLQHIIITP